MKKQMFLKTAITVAALISCLSAYAAPTLIITDGVITNTVVGAAGQALYITPAFGDSWSVIIDNGETKPLVGSATTPVMALTIQATCLGSANDLSITFSDTDYGPSSGTFTAFMDGHVVAGTGGAVTYNTYFDPANGIAALTMPLTASGIISPDGTGFYSNSVTSGTATGNPYSLSQVVTISGATAATYSLTPSLSAPPATLSCSVTPPSGEICGANGGQTFTVTVTGGTGPYSYLWSDGETTSNITVSAAGTYTVTVTDANGNITQCDATLKVNPAPSVTVNSAIVCADSLPVTLTATVTSGTGPFTFAWGGPGGFTASGNPINVSTPGNYSVVVTDSKGCTGNGSGSLTVNPVPHVSVNSSNICAGGSATLTATTDAGTGATFVWNTGATGPSLTVSPASTTTYTVTVTSASHCSAQASGKVTVNPIPHMSVNSSNICAGSSARLTATTDAGTGATFVWNTGATGPSITVSPASTTTYTVTVTSAAGCSAQASGKVTVNPVPICTITTISSVNAGVVSNTASVANAGAGAGYSWTISNGTITYGQNTTSITWTAGTDTNHPVVICVTIINSTGCAATCCANVTVKAGPSGFCTWTPGGWGAPPNGNNVATMLYKMFPTVYSSGVTVGGTYTLKFSNPQAITTFLPNGGTPGVLKKSYLNPVATEAGEFGSQVLALQFNMDASTKGFSKAGLGNLKVVAGYPLSGYTVSQVLALANKVLGGNTLALPAGITVPMLTDLLSGLNGSFDNCTNSNKVLGF
jgi:hypothetical protein